MINQCRQNRTWRKVWLSKQEFRKCWKDLEIAGLFKTRFVDLLNLQISTLTKPTGFTKPTGLNKPTGLTTF